MAITKMNALMKNGGNPMAINTLFKEISNDSFTTGRNIPEGSNYISDNFKTIARNNMMVASSPDGKTMAVGFTSGLVLVEIKSGSFKGYDSLKKSVINDDESILVTCSLKDNRNISVKISKDIKIASYTPKFLEKDGKSKNQSETIFENEKAKVTILGQVNVYGDGDNSYIMFDENNGELTKEHEKESPIYFGLFSENTEKSTKSDEKNAKTVTGVIEKNKIIDVKVETEDTPETEIIPAQNPESNSKVKGKEKRTPKVLNKPEKVIERKYTPPTIARPKKNKKETPHSTDVVRKEPIEKDAWAKFPLYYFPEVDGEVDDKEMVRLLTTKTTRRREYPRVGFNIHEVVWDAFQHYCDENGLYASDVMAELMLNMGLFESEKDLREHFDAYYDQFKLPEE